MNGKIAFVSVVILLLINSCKENEIYSNIPLIEYKRVYFLQSDGKDSLMKLVFSFKDGDGDIGFSDADTSAPFNPLFDSNGNILNKYYYNCYIAYREKIDGVYWPYIPPGKTDTFSYKFRIQNLTPDGKHKAIRGELEMDINISDGQRLSMYDTDTIIYNIYIYDRKLNRSNIIETPPIVWRR